jgi:hypothetical protein
MLCSVITLFILILYTSLLYTISSYLSWVSIYPIQKKILIIIILSLTIISLLVYQNKY